MNQPQTPRANPGDIGRGEHILLTGVTGFLGGEVLVRLHQKWPEAQFLLPVRGRGGQDGARRVARLIDHSFPPESRTQASLRIGVLAADLTEERLGLNQKQ